MSSLASAARELGTPVEVADPLPSPLLLKHRQQAVSHEGSLERLTRLLRHLETGGANATIAVLGGSVSAGSSSRVRPDQSGLYHRKLHRWLQQRFPRATVRHINAAMPAVPPGYMEQCLSLHVPPTVDLVLLEASANMCGRASGARKRARGAAENGGRSDDPCEVGRESVERMLRQILRFPRKPAVIFVHAFPFWTMETPKSWYQGSKKAARGRNNAALGTSAPLSRAEDLAFDFHRQWGHEANEDMLEQLARYYDLPSVSIRNVIWHAMKANTTFNGLTLPQLYYDRIHPSNYGHTILANGLVHVLRKALLQLRLLDDAATASTGTGTGTTGAPSPSPRPLPRPMLPNVAGASSRRLECHDAESLRALAELDRCVGWTYVVERSPSGVPKPGWIATQPLASCTFSYAFSNATSELHRVGIGYLKSYVHMGQVRVDCVHDCTCDGLIVDAHTSEHISPLDLQYFTARRPSATVIGGAGEGGGRLQLPSPRRCGVRLTVLNSTSSGEHKFKLTALFLNKHSDGAFFGRWIFQQAAEAKGAVEIAEQAEARSVTRARRIRASSASGVRGVKGGRRREGGRRGRP